MKAMTKDLKPLGFKGDNIFGSNCHNIYHLAIPKTRKIIVVDNLNQAIYTYALTPTQWTQWETNKLSIVPMNSITVTGGKCIGKYKIEHKGDFKKTFKTQKSLIEYITGVTK
ncbi:MAG: hypothetical protein WC119_00290 [Synergistaceae bacterium]